MVYINIFFIQILGDGECHQFIRRYVRKDQNDNIRAILQFFFDQLIRYFTLVSLVIHNKISNSMNFSVHASDTLVICCDVKQCDPILVAVQRVRSIVMTCLLTFLFFDAVPDRKYVSVNIKLQRFGRNRRSPSGNIKY